VGEARREERAVVWRGVAWRGVGGRWAGALGWGTGGAWRLLLPTPLLFVAGEECVATTRGKRLGLRNETTDAVLQLRVSRSSFV